MTISELETETHGGTDRRDFFAPGRNCWRVCDTRDLAVVRDGAAYFRALREAMIAARRQVLLVGWDFDLEIELLPGESDETGLAPDGYPNMLQDFFEAIVAEKPELHIHLLRWTGSVVLAPGRLVPMARLSMLGSDRIQAAFDGRHPVGACHHQKIVVVDDQLAFCGGIDATDGRWDTPEHAPDDPRRRLRGGKDAMPWHDMTTALTGETARALGDLARTRWERATGQVLPVPGAQDDPTWPASLEVTARGVTTAIARTEPPEQDRPVVNEIETLLADTIRAGQSLIYLESQYFASEAVAEALGERLAEADGPEVVVINPQEAQSAIEDAAMHREREALVATLQARDRYDRFRIWTPVNAAEEQIYVHAKVCVIDDWLLRVGSSNINSRSMAFDTECDVAVIGEDDATRQAIAGVRNGLVAEHLGASPEILARAVETRGSLVRTMDALNPPRGRGLRRLEKRGENPLADLVAQSKIFDPRYDENAMARRGVTSRHLVLGLGLAVAGYLLWQL